MATIEVKSKDKKTLGYLNAGYSRTELLNEKRSSIGSIEQISVEYEIKSRSTVVGYVEITQRDLELKDRSKRTIAKFNKSKGLENPEFLQVLYEKILAGR